MKYYKRNGFSLAELLVALFILTVGIIGVVIAFPLGTRVGKSSEMETVASELAQEKMEEILSQSYSEISVGTIEPEQPLTSPFENYSRETEVNYYDPAVSATTTQDLDIKMVRVKVSWQIALGILNKNIEIFTLISKR